MGGNKLLHWDGAALVDATASHPADVSIADIWGSDSSHVVAVHASGRATVFDGAAWRVSLTGTGNTLTGVRGAGGAVYAVGSAATILRFTR